MGGVEHHLSYFEACVIGLLQGVTELFPISSLGHSVLVPALVGGQWATDLNVSTPESPYLAFVVALHVATALALIVFFWRDWLRIVSGLATSVIRREVKTADQRLGWLLVLGTIPIGLAGLLLEHTFRTTFGKPSFAAVFLMVNGAILLGAERLRRAAPLVDVNAEPNRRLAKMGVEDALIVGASQIGARAPGVSRSGIAMSSGLLRGLSHEDAARFSFLLATPVILAAGLLKIPDLFGPLGDGIRLQALAGGACSAVAAYLSVRFLTRYFETRTLTPFGIYCLVAGGLCVARFTV
jgi:undecaprenyl-diphosphatase